ncbi:MAG: helix-turn-helix domain-containing protein [Alphaproteobacteria bacterium]|nr:helix-turn-helix domain-containing protein [Alphaproteobacteria bacterium]
MTLLQRIKTPFAETAPEPGEWSPSDTRSVGEILQERREELGFSLDEVGAALRIKPGYLAALEQGRTDELPGPAYAIGFVRAYAECLGLGADDVLARFKAETAALDARPDLSFPVPLAERSLPGGAVLLVALILALCGYGTWYYLSTGERSRPERVTELPSALQLPKPEPASPAPAPAAGPLVAGPPLDTPTVASPSPPLPNSAEPAPARGTGPLVPGSAGSGAPHGAAAPPAPAASGVAATTPGNGAGATAPAGGVTPAGKDANRTSAAVPPPAAAPADAAHPAPPGGAARIVIRAAADCWIQVRDADQNIVFSRVLKAGESYKVPPRTGLSLRTGNAGALEIAIDGKNAPSIGSIGTLRRNVALDADALAAGTAVHG